MSRKEITITPSTGTPAWRATEKEPAVSTRCLYVHIDNDANTIKFVGTYVIPPGRDFNVTIRMWDNRTNTSVLRLAYASDGFTPILSSAAMILSIPTIQLP